MGQRSTVGVVCAVVALAAAATLWIGWQGARVVRHVDAMVVERVALPTSTTAARTDAARTTATPEPQAEEALNILLLGTDLMPGAQVGRTDVMVLAHIDPAHKRAALLSFPRDLWVPIPGQGEARINAAYPFGERRIGPGYGAPLAKQTVSDLTALPVQRFVMINFDGFIKLIDELGGIVVDVPAPLTDPDFPLGERRVRVHFDAGPQRMDGIRALTYVRTRHADGDLGRNKRQQQVLMAIFERLRERGVLTNLAALDEYTAVLKDYVRTDLSRQEMVYLLGVAAGMSKGNIERFAIDGSMLVPLARPATFTVDRSALRAVVEELCACQPARVVAGMSFAASKR
jgi:polyisoprenyl-teichoic acid--peptidoglycan teichoic acid transferase